MRRLARRVSSAEQKLIEAAGFCELHQLATQAAKLRSMSAHAARISREIDAAADRAKAPHSPYTRVARAKKR